MSTEWQRFTVDIPKGFDAGTREVIGEDIIDYIRERTKDGKNWRNRDFAGYSKAYEESLNFKIAGKKKGQTPDLTQSGDTLGSLTLLDSRDGKLTIGFEKGSLANAIADGNIRGTYGKSKPVGPKRDFLGITKADLARILDNFTPEDAASGKAASKGLSTLDGQITTGDQGDGGDSADG